MGFRAVQWFMQRVTGLDSTLQAILGRASWHCLDDDAFLKKSRAWLAEKAGTSTRSLERHEPTLAKLNLLVRGSEGYRLPQFFDFDRQNGGPHRQIVRQIVRQNGGAQEEGFLRKGLLQGTSTSTSSQTSKPEDAADDDELKIRRVRERYGIEDGEARAVVYIGIIRHCELGDGSRIRSVEFFAAIVEQLRDECRRGGQVRTDYLAYLKAKADQVRRELPERKKLDAVLAGKEVKA